MYNSINQDSVKTVAKGLQMVESEAKSENPRGIVIDNTNCTIDQRQAYLKAAKVHNYTPIAFFFDVDKNTAMFLDKSRINNTNRDHLSSKVGSIPIHTFFKRLEMPTTKEGFDSVFTVNLVLKFFNPKDEAFYNMIH